MQEITHKGRKYLIEFIDTTDYSRVKPNIITTITLNTKDVFYKYTLTESMCIVETPK